MKDVVAIYARISQEKNDVDVSIAQQIEQGKDFAHSKGMDFLVYKDEGYSGTLTSKERPAMYQLLQDIMSKHSRIKILWGREMFRLYRGNTPKMEIQLVCKKHDVDIYYADKKLDSDDPVEKLMDNMLGVMGEFYVDLSKQNVKQAIRKNFNDGKAHGIAPYGYRTNSDKRLVIDEDQAKWVREMFKWHIDGMGVTSIVKRLTDLGVPTQYSKNHIRFSREWDRTTVYGILKNKLYYGKRKHLDNEIDAPNLAIVDKETFDESMLAFEALKSYTGKRTWHKYLLNDYLICENCGSKYTGRADNVNVTVYRCNSKRKKSGCKNRDIRLEVLEDFIWEYISDTRNLLKSFDESTKNESTDKKRKIQDEIGLLEKANEQLNNENSNVLRLAIKGIVNDVDLEKERKRIQKELVDNNIKISNLKSQLGAVNNESQFIADLKKKIVPLLMDDALLEDEEEFKRQFYLRIGESFSYNQKREYLKKYIEKITVEYVGEVFRLTIHFNKPLNEQVIYMDKRYYVAIEQDSKKEYNLWHKKQHNVPLNTKRLLQAISKIDSN